MITFYFYDNIIQWKEKEDIKEFIMPHNCMKYGKITNIPIFECHLKELKKQIKKINLLRKKLLIILPNHYEEIDKEVLTVILNNLGMKHIKYTKENSLYELKNNQVLLNIHKTYLIMTKKDRNKITNYFYPYNIFDGMEQTIDFIIEKNSKKLRYYLYGSNEKIVQYIEQKQNKNLFYYTNSKSYIIIKGFL